MARSTTPLLRWVETRQVYELLLTEGGVRPVRVDEGLEGWLADLEAAGSFAFEGRAGRLSVIREQRARGTGYWYAYRSSGRRTRKRYLGRARYITLARLEELAAALSLDIKEHVLPVVVESGASPASLLLSKVQPPRLPGSLVARPHLLRRLDAAGERKILLLVAPAGSGKTTLIGQWLMRSAERRALAWVALDGGDDDPYRFWRLLFTACQAWQPQAARAALAALAGAWRPPFVAPPLDELLTTFLNDLERLRAPAGLLVLDDYHCIQDARIHQALGFFVQHLPVTFQVVLLSRVEPGPLPLLRWRARGQLAELTAAELRFTSEETTTFVRQTFAEPLRPEAIARMDESLQGWITGLRLLSFARPAQLMADDFARVPTRPGQLSAYSSAPYQPLLDYLVSEVLNAQPEALQLHLLRLSGPERLNASLGEELTATRDGHALLESVARSGLFLEILDGSWYRFHALFLEALRREAATRLESGERRELALRACRWYERHDLLPEAIDAALQAREFTLAADLIERMGEREDLSELSLLSRWFGSMPEPILRAHPLLCWLAALALQLQQDIISSEEQRRVDALLERAESSWRRSGQHDLLGLLPAFHAMRCWRTGQVASAIDYARQALELLPASSMERPLQFFRAICLFLLGIGAMYEAQFQAARAAFLEAYQLSLPRRDQHFSGGLLVLVASCCYLQGELRQAQAYYQQVLDAARQGGDRDVLGRAWLGLASVSFEWHQLEQAARQTREALSLAVEEDGDLYHAATLLHAQLLYARGELAEARQTLAALEARLQTHPGPEAGPRLISAHLLAAKLALAGADFQTVERILAMPDVRQDEQATITRARLHLSQGQPRQAIQLLESRVETIKEWRSRLELRIVLALAYAACQDMQCARHCLREALAQASAEGPVQIFVAEGASLISLLRHLLQTLIEEPLQRAYAQQLLGALLSEQRHVVTRQPGQTLTVQERRVLQLLSTGASNQQIARELVVSVNTVKDHLKHIYQKLGVNNRLQATLAFETNSEPRKA